MRLQSRFSPCLTTGLECLQLWCFFFMMYVGPKKQELWIRRVCKPIFHHNWWSLMSLFIDGSFKIYMNIMNLWKHKNKNLVSQYNKKHPMSTLNNWKLWFLSENIHICFIWLSSVFSIREKLRKKFIHFMIGDEFRDQMKKALKMPRFENSIIAFTLRTRALGNVFK